MWWRRIQLGCLAIMCVLATACGSESAVTSSSTSTTLRTRLPADTLTFRAVLDYCPIDGQMPEPVDCTSAFPADTNPPDSEVLPQVDSAGTVVAYYVVGPVLVDGSSLERAQASSQTGSWMVNPIFREGPDGIDLFNEAAAACNAKDPTCPTGQLAIVVDGEVISAPGIQQPSFERDQIQISGDFDEASATALADRFNAAAGG